MAIQPTDWQAIRLGHTRHFAAALGFGLSLDLDGQLLITPPQSIDVARCLELLTRTSKQIAQELHAERKMALRCFVGGPHNGQRHGHYPCGLGRAICVKLARAKWAVYWMPGKIDDGRAWYVGEAASEAKGRRLAWNAGSKFSIRGEATYFE